MSSQEQKGASTSGGDLRAVNEEISKFVEAAIDGMVEQKNEELAQYRRQAERNVRLASEGIDAKILVPTLLQLRPSPSLLDYMYLGG